MVILAILAIFVGAILVAFGAIIAWLFVANLDDGHQPLVALGMAVTTVRDGVAR